MTTQAIRSNKATRRQLAYLRVLADRTGQTFVYPKTLEEASAEIDRLKHTRPNTRTERRVERKQIADAIATGPADSSRVLDAEIVGYGSTATWRRRSKTTPTVTQPGRRGDDVGERVELARYDVSAGSRVLVGQRVDGVVRFLPDDLVVLVLGRAASEDSSCRPRSRESRGARADAVRPKQPKVTDNCRGAADECLEDRS